MKHPDDTQEAIECMTKRAHMLVTNGMEHERALEGSVDWWDLHTTTPDGKNRTEDTCLLPCQLPNRITK